MSDSQEKELSAQRTKVSSSVSSIISSAPWRENSTVVLKDEMQSNILVITVYDLGLRGISPGVLRVNTL